MKGRFISECSGLPPPMFSATLIWGRIKAAPATALNWAPNFKNCRLVNIVHPSWTSIGVIAAGRGTHHREGGQNARPTPRVERDDISRSAEPSPSERTVPPVPKDGNRYADAGIVDGAN
jgi:hypothetical protein